jgi:ribosomal protein L12E/L44/L45/RPP1/RPP2
MRCRAVIGAAVVVSEDAPFNVAEEEEEEEVEEEEEEEEEEEDAPDTSDAAGAFDMASMMV